MRGLVDVRGEGFQIRGGFHSGPEDAGAFFVWEKAQTAKFEIYRFHGTDSGESVLKRAQFCGIGFAEKFQSDVEIFGMHPFQLWSEGAKFFQQGCKGASNVFGNFDGDEESHAGGLAQLAGLTRRGWGLPSKR